MVWDESRTARVVQAVAKRVRHATEGSVFLQAVTSLVTRMETVVRNSLCYRWLTADPTPSVVVIDLRETRTVAPFVRLLETVSESVERAWADSRLAAVAAAVDASVSHSRTARLLATLLEPPPPPGDEDDSEAG